MDRTEKHDLTRFFNMLKTKYEIPSPQTKIHGKVTCRDGIEYIEKPFNQSDIESTSKARLQRQRAYEGCGHASSVCSPYKDLGHIFTDSRKMTFKHFKEHGIDKEAALALNHVAKWKNATKKRVAGEPEDKLDTINDVTKLALRIKKSRRRSDFTVKTKGWPPIHSTGYAQISEAVAMTNDRVAATRGTRPYFLILEDYKKEVDPLSGSTEDVGESQTKQLKQPSVIDGLRRDVAVKRLEGFIYILTCLQNIKAKDLKNKQPLCPDSLNLLLDDLPSSKHFNSANRPGQQIPDSTLKMFSWNDGLPPWQKIRQENDCSTADPAKDREIHDSTEGKDHAIDLQNLRKDFTDMQTELDFRLKGRLKRLFRDDKDIFIRRFHSLKKAPTLSLGMTDLRKIDRTSHPTLEADQLKTATKQDWYVEALKELQIHSNQLDYKVESLLASFERFSRLDIAVEIRALKAKLCYLAMSMPVYCVLQPEYQYVFRFIISKCVHTNEDCLANWMKLRFKRGPILKY